MNSKYRVYVNHKACGCVDSISKIKKVLSKYQARDWFDVVEHDMEGEYDTTFIFGLVGEFDEILHAKKQSLLLTKEYLETVKDLQDLSCVELKRQILDLYDRKMVR